MGEQLSKDSSNQCSNYSLKERPEFKNLPKEWMSGEAVSIQAQNNTAITLDSSEPADLEEYQALTEKEELDLEQLMKQCNTAVSNAEAFIETLTKDLSILDGENVQSVLASEQQVTSLMTQLEVAMAEVEKVEVQLNSYEDVLCHVRNTMHKMEEKNMLIEVANKNNQKLLAELEKVVYRLELPSKHQMALVDADLTNPAGLQQAIEAGKALQAVMNAEIHPALVRLTAVQDQKKRFDKWKSKFSHIISRHLNNLFIHLGNDPGDIMGTNSGDLVLPKNSLLHKELQAYTELMHWCKVMDRKAYTALCKVYTNALGKLYERDIKHFLDGAKQNVSGHPGGSKEDLSAAKRQAKESKAGGGSSGGGSGGGQLLGVERDQWGADHEPSERARFDQVLERVLAQLEPVCLSEQNFCVSFFQLDVLSPTTKNTQTTLDGIGLDNRLESEPVALPQKRIEKQVNEEVRRMMGDIFGCIEPELVNFINHHERIDSIYCMHALVRLSQHVMSAQDAGSFLSKTFGSVLVQVKRSYDRYMQAQLKSIQDIRVNKKSKCGILPFVANFEEFAKTSELIFNNSERRTDLDKWYVRLVGAMFEVIPLIAAEHQKTPQEVVKMENFHHLFALLSQLKISVLDAQRKEAKQKYNDALKAYVTRYFGRPLEKLNQFFEGVQAKVSQGVKESEISYQMAFSKQELRKVIREYPGREVKKGLYDLYRKVNKHLCEEENLLQVVWRAMQEEFIQQYKYIEELIQRCYPGSMITLDFSIEDILQFFSEIARSH
ncbi:exocyst complex component 1-like isoform X3 [Nilaparvata lugens]|uniref:exocyst complex component 1-like isoform X3 n=1 Tax=Nilaparvata lugens TaxID=108931 RepID=UPI00193D7104|nr:exocyst complex component 1-like isoform X3 [Nilaparvata lugens]